MLQLERTKTDRQADADIYASTGSLVISKALSLKHNSSFLNRISVLIVSRYLPNCPQEDG